MSRVNIVKYAVPALAIATSLIAAVPAGAADMVGYVPPPRHHVARPHYARVHVVRTTYLAEDNRCADRIIEYRNPYIPHTEVIRVCGRYRY